VLVRRNRPGPLILFIGGNNHYMSRHGANNIEMLIRFGDVLIYDHAGYGDSEGAPSTENIIAGGGDVVGEAKKLAVENNQKLVVWSASMGGFMSILGAAAHNPDGLIFEGLAPTARDWALALGARMGRPRARVEQRMIDLAKPDPMAEYFGPVLQLAGLGDQVVPIQLARKLNSAFRELKVDVEYHELNSSAHDLRTSPETPKIVTEFLLRTGLADQSMILDPDSFGSGNLTLGAETASAVERAPTEA